MCPKQGLNITNKKVISGQSVIKEFVSVNCRFETCQTAIFYDVSVTKTSTDQFFGTDTDTDELALNDMGR
jgi:hypothetical protein